MSIREASRSPPRRMETDELVRYSKRASGSPSPSHSRSPSPSHRRRSSRSPSPTMKDNYRDRPHSRSRSRSRGRPRHGRKEPNPEPSNVLGVFGLSHMTRQRDLEEIYGKYGLVKEAVLVVDRRTNQSRGFGFVYFERQEEAERALKETNGMRLDGRYIRVDYSATTRPHSPTPGRYMGERRERSRDRRYVGSGGSGSGRDHYYRRRSSYRSRSPRRQRSRSRSRSRDRYNSRDRYASRGEDSRDRRMRRHSRSRSR